MKLSTYFFRNRALYFLGFILALSLIASTVLASSPDGSTITTSSGGSLTTSGGTWTFSSATGAGGKKILLNGKTAEGGSGVKLLIANNGHMYTENSQSTWWLWSGTAWSTTTSPLAVSANNSTIVDGSGKDLATSAGLWTFSTATGAGGYMILLNGVSAGGGSGVKLEVANSGQMYTLNSEGAWWVWSGSSWKATSAPGSTPPPSSGTATVSWTDPRTNTNGSAITNLAGYYINYGTSPTSLTHRVTLTSPSATTYTLSNLASGSWYFSVMAYTTTGTQSSASNLMSKTIP